MMGLYYCEKCGETKDDDVDGCNDYYGNALCDECYGNRPYSPEHEKLKEESSEES